MERGSVRARRELLHERWDCNALAERRGVDPRIDRCFRRGRHPPETLGPQRTLVRRGEHAAGRGERPEARRQHTIGEPKRAHTTPVARRSAVAVTLAIAVSTSWRKRSASFASISRGIWIGAPYATATRANGRGTRKRSHDFSSHTGCAAAPTGTTGQPLRLAR